MKRQQFSLFLLFALIAIAVGEDDAQADSSTIVLTKDNFDEELKTTNFFVKFYAPW